MPTPNGAATTLVIHADGASRGNPGPAAFGYVIRDQGGRDIEARGEFIGDTTNNVAEYRGLIAAARRAAELSPAAVEFRVDSQLLERQVRGQYRVKAAHLKPLFGELTRVLERIPRWSVVHVPREANHEADRLANRALDVRGVVT